MVLRLLLCLVIIVAGLAMVGAAVYLMWQLGLMLAGLVVVWLGATRINVEPAREPEVIDETETEVVG